MSARTVERPGIAPISARAAGAGGGRGWTTGVLAGVAFLPLLWTSPGKVSADTKSYLTLDPARLLGKAASLWDPGVGLGTVTHQTIGYLFPLGPYYWTMQRLGIPMWITQRLWLGLLFFAAGTGVARLLRWMGWRGPAVLVAALAYQLSPYVLDYAARISVILLPWAALGWLVYLTARSLRDGGWRWPAAFALTVLAVGGVNATALVLVGLGPACWVVHDVAIVRAVRVRAALAAVTRIGLLTLPVSAWWIAGLTMQGRFGIPILRYTETYEAVARTSTSAEVLRGLGYWFFYGQDKVSAWVEPARPYTQSVVLVVLSFLPPALALWSLATTRWRHRAFAVLVLVVGLTVAVGAHPYGAPAPYGALFKRLSTTTAGSALRSTPRAVPLVVLGLAMALGAGACALGRVLEARLGPTRPAPWRLAPPVATVFLLAANLPSLWTGHLLTASILRPTNVPGYWRDAAKAIDAGDRSTRVLETPAADFADYRWGGTVDPITPGITDRAYVARELVPYGSAPGADLLNAFERRIADRVGEPAATAPLLKMLSVGTVVARNDLQYERYRSARPRSMAAALAATPGLAAGATFGPPARNRPIARLPLADAEELTTPASIADPPPVATYDVTGARPIVSTAAIDSPTVVSADGEGLVDLAAAGLLPTDAPVLSMGDLAVRPDGVQNALGGSPNLIVTDTNRRQARRWGSVRENLGYTEFAGEVPLRRDITDNRLDVFPGSDDSSATVTEQGGVTRVQATGYGNPITYTPEDRAASAIDGDPTTAWRVGAFADVTGERIEVVPSGAVTTDHLTLLQPVNGARNRWITAVRITVNGEAPRDVELDDSSRTQPGQRIDLGGARAIDSLTIEIRRTNFTKLPGYRGISAVGFAEIGLGDVRIDEVLRLPTDLFDKAPEAAATQHLTVVMTRDRASALEPNRDDPERSIKRSFALPAERTFTVHGTVRAAPRAADDVLGGVLPVTGAMASASARLAGGPATRGQLAIDADPATAWQTPIDEPLQSLTITALAPATVDRLGLIVRADGRHSVPTALAISADGGAPVPVTVPPIADASGRDVTAEVGVDVPALTGRTFVVSITSVRRVASIDYFTELPVTQPVAIAEIGLGGGRSLLQGAVAPGAAGTACRTDLLTVDDEPVPLRVVGDLAALAAGGVLTVAGCGAPLVLDATEHVVRTAVGRNLGLDIDRLVFDAVAPPPPTGGGGGTAGPAGDTAAQAMSFRPGAVPAQGTTPSPKITILAAGLTSYRLSVAATRAPFWLLLGQSRNPGWHAEIGGRDLGPSTLVNGYANGWFVSVPATGGPTEVRLHWTPQRIVDRAIVVSVGGTALCLLILAVGAIRARRRRWATGASGSSSADHLAGPVAGRTASHVAGDWASASSPARRAGGRLGAVVAPPSGLVPTAPLEEAVEDVTVRPPPRGVTRRDVVVTTVGTVLAFFVAGWWPALVVPLTALAVTRLPTLPTSSAVRPVARWSTRFLRLVPPGLVGLGVVYVVAKQLRYHLPTDLEWPRAFEPAHVLTWCAVAVTTTIVVLSPASAATADGEDGEVP